MNTNELFDLIFETVVDQINDSTTRKDVIKIINKFYIDKGKDLNNLHIICDESNNTPYVIDDYNFVVFIDYNGICTIYDNKRYMKECYENR